MSMPIIASLLLFGVVYLPGSHTSAAKDDIIVSVNVPPQAEVGSTVDFTCHWKLSPGNKLYSVKWYKGEHEFFRYVPEVDPQMKTFHPIGVSVDKEANTEHSVRLTNLTLETSGQYKCEVSTEAPVFAIGYKLANLTVVSLPERKPDITGLYSHYAVGANVTANCTSWPSKPPASISWTVNGEPVPSENTIVYKQPSPTAAKGGRTISGLRLEADARYFERDGGTATLRCIAMVGIKEFVSESRVIEAHVNNERLSAAGDMLRGSGKGTRVDLNFTMVLLGIAAAILHQANILAT
ncbi:uncharacterized protein LOC124305127 isoform X1 [Neodiprion virginianus]|uniref:uncharacterized protein LOC124305127 isoform X1 n=1 Tax=Neodiprion virginianus TaxID=2961670 RepID=UPI001EE737A5|nr:uncharacterized protein LOC124305127 isoform X1 [Neodiprion virginianus]XP_046620158.1 uncharacterized protein LOC124305127 isoform X1 [Neodiprion virginianus]